MDFAKKLSTTTPRVFDAQALSALKTATDAVIIANADTTRYTKATGMSIWLPTDSGTYKRHAIRYQGLKFNAATHWNDALSALLQGVHTSTAQ